jgi:serine/threonine-protein kinase TTK/MPS1
MEAVRLAAQKENVVPSLYAREKLSSDGFTHGSTPTDVARERETLVDNSNNKSSKLAVRFSSNTNTPRQASCNYLGGGTPLARTPLGSIQPAQGGMRQQGLSSAGKRTTTTTTTTTTPSSRSHLASAANTAANMAVPMRRGTWSGDIDIYVGSQQKDSSRRDLQALALKTQRVKRDHTSSSAWWGFLSSEEERGGTSLYKLYEWATKLVPRKGNKNNETYINLWLGYIKRQRNEEDCRDTFKTLRNMGISERSAVLYQQWVLFEIAAGNNEKARGIAKKGVQAGAFTKSEMETFLSRCLPTTATATTNVSTSNSSGNGSVAVQRDQSHLSRLAKSLEQQQQPIKRPLQQQQQPVKVIEDEDTSNSNRTCSSVLAPKTFCSSNYSSTITTGTPFRNHHDQSGGATATATTSVSVSSSRASYANSYTPTGTATTVSSVTPAKQVDNLLGVKSDVDFATPGKSGGSDQSNLLKGPKRLGLKRFAGPARRIKPGEEPGPRVNVQQQQGNPTTTTTTAAMAERKTLPPPTNPTLTENYTDLTAKLSPIVEASYSTNSSSRSSTRSAASSCQTDDLAASALVNNPPPSSSMQMSSGGVSNVAQRGSVVPNHRMDASSSAMVMEATKPAAPVVPQQKVEVKQQPVQQQQVRETNNSVTVHNVKYTVLECVGKGGSSKVFKVISPEHKIFALKRIKLEGREKEAAAGFMDEITLLNRFKGRNHIVQLVDSEILRESGLIYMVLEYGEVDLARLLQRREKARTAEGQQNKIDLNFIRLHWQQMLEAVHIIHEERIVHSDLKPANFLFVEGILKLIDFGIAKAIQNDTTHIARESQVGTLNYMSPEAILSGNTGSRSSKQTKVGRASDVWSLGCILYQMVYGHTPFSHLQFIQKLHAITDQNHQIEFPPIQNQPLLDVIKRCLDRNPKTRIGIPDLLDHLFLNPSQESVTMTPSANMITPEFLNSMLMQMAKGGQSSADISKLSQELCKQLASGSVPDLNSLMVTNNNSASASAPPIPAPPPPPPAAAMMGGNRGGPPGAPPPPPPPMPPSLAPQNKMQMIMADIKKKRQLKPAGDSNNQSSRGNSKGLQHGGDIAAAVAAKALARSKQRQEALVALENKDKGFNDELKSALQKQHAALKPVSLGQQENRPPPLVKSSFNDPNGSSSVPAAGSEEEGSCNGMSLAGALRHGLAKKFQNALNANNNDDTVTMTGDITGGSATEDTDMSWQ